MKNFHVACCTGALLVGLLAPMSGGAQEYPVKQIVCIVPTEAGGDGDLLARALFDRLSARIGRPIVVVNKPGAAGATGYRELHDAKPDGYTIGLAFPTLYMNKMKGMMPWDHHNYTLIAQHGSFTPVVVSSAKSSYPLKTIQETVAAAKANPGKLKFALSVVGGSWWMAGKLFEANTKTTFKNIPQEGSGAVVITQLAGGHTDVGVSGLATARSQIEAGNLHLLATFGRERMSGKYSNVPTLIEAGYNVTWDSPNFFVGPPGMPKNIVEKLAKAIEIEANSPEFKNAAFDMNATPLYQAPGKLLAYLDQQKETARDILEKNGVMKKK